MAQRRQPASSLSGVAFERPSVAGRSSGAAVAAWGAFIGPLTHMLHHVGPLAGAALLAGASERVLFAAIGLLAAIPNPRQLYRRFKTGRTPAITVGVFAATSRARRA